MTRICNICVKISKVQDGQKWKKGKRVDWRRDSSRRVHPHARRVRISVSSTPEDAHSSARDQHAPEILARSRDSLLREPVSLTRDTASSTCPFNRNQATKTSTMTGPRWTFKILNASALKKGKNKKKRDREIDR